MRKLKQCPFCGGEVELVKQKSDEFEFVLVSCKNCDTTIGIGGSDNKQKVTEAWNKRANPWHTGTPTEDGYYLCHVMIEDEIFDACFYRKNGAWDIGKYSINPYTFEVVAWQSIEPFKEEI